MAKLTFGIESNIGNTSVDSPVLTNVQMTRFLDYIWEVYPQENVIVDSETGVETRTPKSRTNANVAAAFNEWAQGLWEGTKANVFRFESEKVSKVARDKVTEIDR